MHACCTRIILVYVMLVVIVLYRVLVDLLLLSPSIEPVTLQLGATQNTLCPIKALLPKPTIIIDDGWAAATRTVSQPVDCKFQQCYIIGK